MSSFEGQCYCSFSFFPSHKKGEEKTRMEITKGVTHEKNKFFKYDLYK